MQFFCPIKAATLGDARESTPPDPKKITTNAHVKWGHESARQARRASVDPEGDNLHQPRRVGEVLGRCEVCRAFDEAPHVPVAGTSTASMFNETAHVNPPFQAILLRCAPW